MVLEQGGSGGSSERAGAAFRSGEAKDRPHAILEASIEHMDSERAEPGRTGVAVEVLPAAPEQAPILANLLELYAHDLSAFFDVRLGDDGRFGYPALSLYWREPDRFPFLVRADGQLAGFVLVSRGSRLRDDPDVWDMAEFFVTRGWRRHGVGAAAAREVWLRFPGAWEVRVLARNSPALGFWRSAVRAFAGAGVRETVAEVGGKTWQVLCFHAPR